MLCKLIIHDEVNVKFEGLPIEVRREISNALKFMDPSARHTPAFKLGRWDGKEAFFGLGGTGYINHLETAIGILQKYKIQIDQIDDRRKKVDISLSPVTERYWADQGVVWPKGHPDEGNEIILRDYQYEAINDFLKNPQSLQEIATGAGKTITTATLSHITEPYGRSIVVVPNKSLVLQTEEDYINCGLDVGVYFGDRKDSDKTHTICTWQSLNTLQKRYTEGKSNLSLEDFVEGVGTLIVDECFSPDTLILTPTGYKPIKNIRIGDRVINYSEKDNVYKEDTVINVFENMPRSSNEDMLELEFDNGNKIQVTANHKFLTNDHGWVRADELTDEMTVKSINTLS